MNPVERNNAQQPLPTPDVVADGSPAWEEIETGRFMPRRIRGSYLGRELG